MHIKKILLAVCATLAITASYAGDASGDLAIIVNKASKLDDVTSGELTKYFMADKTKAPDGTKVILIMQDAGLPARDAALKGIYKMNEADYANHFVEATFTGAVAAAPKALPSPGSVKKFVADNPGALSYVAGSDIDDTVKVLKVDGKAPGDDGYKLKMK